jgi:hypothetical protein
MKLRQEPVLWVLHLMGVQAVSVDPSGNKAYICVTVDRYTASPQQDQYKKNLDQDYQCKI